MGEKGTNWQVNPILGHLDQVMQFRQTLSSETDRGVALVCAAYLDEELKALLQKTFVDVPNIVSKLFDGALATFSSRIDLSFATGLISRECHGAFHLIRKTRNAFAHEHRERSFADEDISARCRELIPFNPSSNEKDPRALYVRAVLGILAQVHVKTELSQHSAVPPAKPLDAIRNSFSEHQSTLSAVMADLTEDQMSQLLSPETRLSAKKRLVLETLERLGNSKAHRK